MPTRPEILRHAGYQDIVLHRCDQPITIGADIEDAIDLMMALGPAGEILLLQGDRAAHLHETVRDALRTGLAELVTPSGVIAQASTWTITAIASGVADAGDGTRLIRGRAQSANAIDPR